MDGDRSLGAHRARLVPMGVLALSEDEGELGTGGDDADPRSGIRKPATLPTWIHLGPPGPQVKGRDGRSFAVRDAHAAVAASEMPMLLDWDHESMFGGSSRAAAWFDELVFVDAESVSPDRPAPGFWGHVERWTPEGAADVRAFRFRNISPVIRTDDIEAEDGTPASVLVAFENATLTNVPNLRMVSINAESTQGVLTMDEEQLAQLRALLGLEEDADAAAILAAVEAALAPPEEEEPEGESAEMTALRAAHRVLEGEADALRTSLAAHAKRAAEDTRATQEALVDLAIKEGRALAAHRTDLVKLACSNRGEDREMFLRLTEHRIGGAPTHSVTRAGEVSPRGKAPAKSAKAQLAQLSDAQRHKYTNLKRAMGWTHARTMEKVLEGAE